MYIKDLSETNDNTKVKDSTNKLVGRGNNAAVVEARTTTEEEDEALRRSRRGSMPRRGSITKYSFHDENTDLNAALDALSVGSVDDDFANDEEEESHVFPSVRKPSSSSSESDFVAPHSADPHDADDDEAVRVGTSDDSP